jgi:chitinase
MVWEVSHDYIEGVGNPILDSIAVVLHEETTGIRDIHKKRATGSRLDASKNPNAQIKRVDALGKSVQYASHERRLKNKFIFRVKE